MGDFPLKFGSFQINLEEGGPPLFRLKILENWYLKASRHKLGDFQILREVTQSGCSAEIGDRQKNRRAGTISLLRRVYLLLLGR